MVQEGTIYRGESSTEDWNFEGLPREYSITRVRELPKRSRYNSYTR